MSTYDEKPISETRTFSALLEDLRTWLEDEGCHNVAMESKGVYWKSVYAILEDFEEINDKIELFIEQFKEAEELLDGILGISKVAAAAIIGEIGINMSKFSRVENICSWAGLSPSCNESAGKTRSTKTRHGNPCIKSILCEVAWTVTRRKGTYLSNWYWKVKQRSGAKKAGIGLARKILVIIYTLLKENISYNEEKFAEIKISYEKKREKKLIQELQKRGFKVEPLIA